MRQGLTVLDSTNQEPEVMVIIPFSRSWSLERFFARFMEIDFPITRVGFLFYVDCNDKVADEVCDVYMRRFIDKTSHVAKRWIGFYYAGNPEIQQNHFYLERRARVASIHDTIKGILPACEFVMGLEDDTLVSRETFFRLYKDILEQEDAGLVSGCEVGRWGLKHVGGWIFHDRDHANDIIDLESVIPQEHGVIAIGGSGLYCFIARAGLYKSHQFTDYLKCDFIGPDMAFGRYVGDSGFKVYMDFDVVCDHMSYAENTGNIEVFRQTDYDVCGVRYKKSKNWYCERTQYGKE